MNAVDNLAYTNKVKAISNPARSHTIAMKLSAAQSLHYRRRIAIYSYLPRRVIIPQLASHRLRYLHTYGSTFLAKYKYLDMLICNLSSPN